MAQNTRVSGSAWTESTTTPMMIGRLDDLEGKAFGGQLLADEMGDVEVFADDQRKKRQDDGDRNQDDGCAAVRAEDDS